MQFIRKQIIEVDVDNMKSSTRWKMNPFNGILRVRTNKLQKNTVDFWSWYGQNENF